MKKQFFIVLAVVYCSVMNAQNSDTYEIEKLSTPDHPIAIVPAGQLYQKIEQNLIKISVTDDLVLNDAHPVLGGFLKAYKEHRPVTISPDIMWLLICQGFGQHVNNNAEELRNKFVDFQGQKELTVARSVSPDTDMKTFPWEGVFPEFVDKIAEYTGKELTKNLSADFTTTTKASLISSQITIMESMKKYFKYKVIMTGCGIPSVTIEGTVEDWKKILVKLDFLSRYDLEWWISEVKPIVQKIIDTKQGKKFDKNFWMNMVKFHREGLYGSYTDVDGWLLKFYPYYSDGKRANFKKISGIGIFPPELVRVPFIFCINSSDGATIKSYKMEFWSGFMGLKQNEKTFNLKPEIGWAINLLPENEEEPEEIRLF
ncbi:MAG: DUF4419 domain-containing protein [Dysgonomonas sp.]